MLKRIALSLLAALLLVPLAASPSSAASRTVRDKRGDGGPAFDIKKAHFSNGRHAVRASARFRPHRPGADCLTIVIDVGRYGGKAWDAITCINKRANTSHALYKLSRSGSKRVRCRGMRGKWTIQGKLAARVKVPQRCMHKIGRARFKAVSKNPHRRHYDQTRSVRLGRG